MSAHAPSTVPLTLTAMADTDTTRQDAALPAAIPMEDSNKVLSSDGSDKILPSDDDTAHAGNSIRSRLPKETTEYKQQIGWSLNRLLDGTRNYQNVLEHERESGLIELRARQSMIQIGLTEARIHEMEEELQKLKSYVFDLPREEFQKKSKMKYPVHLREVRRSTADNFEVTSETNHAPIETRPALEVLVSQTGVLENSTDQPQSTTRKSTGLYTPLILGYRTPERIRIRSTPLLIHLKRLTGEHVETNDTPDWYSNNEHRFPGFVFLRPFKLFVKYQHRIRQSLVELQLQVDESKDVSSPADATKKIRYDAYGSEDFKFDDEDLLADLKLLVDILDNDLQPTFHLKKCISNETASTIEFADLWHLFDHGTIVILQSDEARAYRVINFTGGREPLTPIMPNEEDRVPALDGFVVDCLGLTFNGSDVVPTLHKFKIHRFPGSRPISSLSVYPLVFHKNSQSLSDGLRNRGRRFMDITTPPFSHHFMTGRTLDETSHDVEAPVIIDMAAAFNSVAQWRPKMTVEPNDITKADPRETYLVSKCKHSWRDTEGCCGHDTVFKDRLMDEKRGALFTQNNGQLLGPRGKAELTDDDFLLLPDRVHGFVLRNRQWVTMKVTDLSEVKYLNNFEKLMLPEKHKTSILALVNTHERVQQNSGTSVGAALDLVRGKGTGLIMLLHGEPGVGKTSTAECVADSTRRPLYPITCGDVGETAMEVEKNLTYNFTLAHKWGCVLLLDEADVFLAKRSKTDLRRNAVTSVFLRSLEYYAGILFLTTNRVGGIDPAFKSRIHLSLFYPRLRKDETIKLYKVFVQRAKDEQARLGSTTFKIDKKQIIDFAKRHYREMEREGLGTWNGRQIRNAFQAAIALVEHDGQQAGPGAPKPTLGDKQFEVVAESSKEFDRYLYTTLGGGESDIAKREEWRADRFQDQFRSGSKPGRPQASKSGSARAEIEPDTDDTSSESEGPDSDDDSDDGDVVSQASRKKDQPPAGLDAVDGSASDFEAFRQFLKFKQGRR